MSKKHKNDYWDTNSEDQLKILDAFYEAETKDKNVMDLLKVDPLKEETGIPSSLEQSIIESLTSSANPTIDDSGDEDFWNTNSMNEDDAIDDDESWGTFTLESDDDDEEEPDEEEVKEDTKPVKNIGVGLRKITYTIREILHRMIVNDGDIAPTAFNFDIAVAQEIVGVYDADDITDKINLLDLYITSLKHPTAIYLKDDFIDEYGCVESFDDDKFVFMSVDNFVLAYAINIDSKRHFTEYVGKLTEHSTDINDILKIYVSLAFACGTMHQAFFVEEDDYLAYFMNSTYNQKDLFKKVFFEDKSTNMSFSGDSEMFSDIISVEALQKLARNTISAMTGEDYFGEDEIEEYLSDNDDNDDAESGETDTMKVSKDTAIAANNSVIKKEEIPEESKTEEVTEEKSEETAESNIEEAESEADIQINIPADDNDSDELPEIPVQRKN